MYCVIKEGDILSGMSFKFFNFISSPKLQINLLIKKIKKLRKYESFMVTIWNVHNLCLEVRVCLNYAVESLSCNVYVIFPAIF